MSKVLHLTEADFDATINGALPVLVDFWAEWCGPCRMISPVLDELAKQYEGKVVIAKVNVDEAGPLAARFGITSIPNLKLFKAGTEADQIIGAAPIATFKALLDRHLGA